MDNVLIIYPSCFSWFDSYYSWLEKRKDCKSVEQQM